MKTKKEVLIYTDGSCIPNPGAGGYAAVLLSDNKRKENLPLFDEFKIQ